jgi:hypothetical protein
VDRRRGCPRGSGPGIWAARMIGVPLARTACAWHRRLPASRRPARREALADSTCACLADHPVVGGGRHRGPRHPAGAAAGHGRERARPHHRSEGTVLVHDLRPPMSRPASFCRPSKPPPDCRAQRPATRTPGWHHRAGRASNRGRGPPPVPRQTPAPLSASWRSCRR